ncbi:unnamed protein product [Ectocarpus fasciculatus]
MCVCAVKQKTCSVARCHGALYILFRDVCSLLLSEKRLAAILFHLTVGTAVSTLDGRGSLCMLLGWLSMLFDNVRQIGSARRPCQRAGPQILGKRPWETDRRKSQQRSKPSRITCARGWSVHVVR